MVMILGSGHGDDAREFPIQVSNGSDRLLIVTLYQNRSGLTLTDDAAVGGTGMSLLYSATDDFSGTNHIRVFYLLESYLADLPGEAQFVNVGNVNPAGETTSMYAWALYSGVDQGAPESSQEINTDFQALLTADPAPRTDGSLIVLCCGNYWGESSPFIEPANGAEMVGWGKSANIFYRSDSIDSVQASASSNVRWLGWAGSFRAAGAPGISQIGDDDTVYDGETGVPVTGEDLPISGAVSMRSGLIDQSQGASERTTESFTWSEVSRGNLPYSDSYHDHQLVVAAAPADMARAVVFNPADGFAAYPLHPDHANQTPGESVLAGLTITAGMQLKVPSSVTIGGSPVDITWEISGGYATGRITLLGTVIDDSVQLPGVELHDGTEWDDRPVTLTPSGEVSVPGIVIELTARNGSPVPNQSGITAVVRESVTAAGVLYQTDSASITSSTMTLSSPLIGSIGDTVCVTLLSADGKTGGLWPAAPVIDLSAT